MVIGDIFKGRATRFDDDDIRGMRTLRDTDAPSELPDDIWDQCIQNDEELQDIMEEIELARTELCPRSRISATKPRELRQKYLQLLMKCRNRKSFLKRRRLREFRDEWFKNRTQAILTGSAQADTPKVPEILEFSAAREAVVQTLYPSKGAQASLFSAAEALVAFINSSKSQNKWIIQTIKRKATTEGGRGK